MCSRDPIFGTNKNRIIKNVSFERAFTQLSNPDCPGGGGNFHMKSTWGCATS